MEEVFTGNFTQQLPLPEAAMQAAARVLQSGRLHRYNVTEGEVAEVALLEEEYAAFQGAKYCLAVASGGYALGCALRAVGVKPGDAVLTNAFTLAPVPGAIASLGARPVFVETTPDLTIDLGHLERLLPDHRGGVLLLSHMRGHICDMELLIALCDAADVTVIEDCAHTMGASWQGTLSGQHGRVACFSTQTYKHMNSGEGGLITTDDPALMARAILLSGSYMLYDRHRAAPPAEYFEKIRLETPNISGRMDNLRAAILRPQLAGLADACAEWNRRYRVVQDGLQDTPGLALIHRPQQENFVGSSFQFRLPGWGGTAIRNLVARCAARGVELKWFGAEAPHGFTSRYEHWQYADPAPLPQTDRVLAELLDLRLPLTFSIDDCALIARIIRAEVARVGAAAREVAQ